MKSPRFKKLAWWLAGIYLTWSLFVYFGSLGSESHSWWPMFLYPLIWPWGWIEQLFLQPLLDGWLAPDPKTAPASAWMLMDHITGVYYIVIGTLWFWIVGKMISRISNRLFPMQGEGRSRPPENNARDLT